MSNTTAVFALLASAVVILGGLTTVARVMWKAAGDVRENRAATQANTRAVRRLTTKMHRRIAAVEARVSEIEDRIG